MIPTADDVIGVSQSLAIRSLLTGLLSPVLLRTPGVLSAQNAPAKPTETEDAVTLSPRVVVSHSTDGEPVASASNELCRWNGGFWHRGHYGIGYGFSVVADTMERIVRIHCGRWGMKGFLNAWLSDGSVPPVEYLTPDVADMKIADTTFTIRYRAATPGQKLHFVWRHLGEPWDSDANLWVAAVTLAEPDRR